MHLPYHADLIVLAIIAVAVWLLAGRVTSSRKGRAFASGIVVAACSFIWSDMILRAKMMQSAQLNHESFTEFIAVGCIFLGVMAFVLTYVLGLFFIRDRHPE